MQWNPNSSHSIGQNEGMSESVLAARHEPFLSLSLQNHSGFTDGGVLLLFFFLTTNPVSTEIFIINNINYLGG